MVEILKNVDKVLAIGISILADSLRLQGVHVVEVDWSPPPELDEDLKDVLNKMF